MKAKAEHMKVYEVPLKTIEPPKTLIREIDGAALTDLKESIKKNGVLQPILINFVREGVYEIVFGNHRYFACKNLGMKTIPACITKLEPRKALILSLTENIQRVGLNPFREGEIFYKLVGEPKLAKTRKPVVGHHVFIEALSQELGKSVYYVKSRIRLFLYFDPCLKDEIGKTLTLTNAVQMSKFSHVKQREIFEKIKKGRQEIKGTILNPLQTGNGASFAHSSGTPYCYCPNCGSKHLRGVSIESDFR